MRTVTTTESFGKSDIGKRRANNEDVFALLPEIGFFALADGMGGHNAGEIAAHETISYLCRSMQEFFLEKREGLRVEVVKDLLCETLENCNQYVHQIASQNVTLEGMGTTVCAALVYEGNLIYSHIGDSRIYLLRQNSLCLLTEDHSLVNEVANQKNITIETARTRVSRSVITRSVGKRPHVTPDIEAIELDEGDLILLCSDGLSDVVPKKEIERILCLETSLETKANELINLAKSNDGGDNITIITVRNGYLSRQ